VTTYSYLNAVLDANPSVVKLVLTPEVYAVAVGDVPAGEASIPGRVALFEEPPGLLVNRGYDVANGLVVQFFC
jgi:hypothetical protein